MGYNGTPWSKSQYYRRMRRAQELGCDIDAVPDRRGKHGNQARGSLCGRWTGGTVISSHGYKKVQVGRTHPLADPNGYVYEHLLVWVSAGNPKPPKGEVLHHISGDKLDNRIENLALLQNGEHVSGHVRGELGRRRSKGEVDAGQRPGERPDLLDEIVHEWPEAQP